MSRLTVAVEPCRSVLAAARAAGLLIIHTRECHRPDLSDALRLKIERGDPYLRIGAPGPMGRILVCGVTTEVCVNTTVREANDRGFRCIVLGDCCASYFREFHIVGLAMIKAQGGICGWVSSSQPVLRALDSH